MYIFCNSNCNNKLASSEISWEVHLLWNIILADPKLVGLPEGPEDRALLSGLGIWEQGYGAIKVTVLLGKLSVLFHVFLMLFIF